MSARLGHRWLAYSFAIFQRTDSQPRLCAFERPIRNGWANAAMESVSALLEPERTAGKVYRAKDDARAAMLDHVVGCAVG